MRKHIVDQHTDEQCEQWGYSRDLIYQEYQRQIEMNEPRDGEQSFLGKRVKCEVDDDDCEFRKRVCMGI